ncbi:hypothetical protein [Viridibacillus arvi]|uniref:hypothetical protein n=1 Tax=Viridibacillus arvi TaxID=263475 RepID=UPI003D005E29
MTAEGENVDLFLFYRFKKKYFNIQKFGSVYKLKLLTVLRNDFEFHFGYLLNSEDENDFSNFYKKINNDIEKWGVKNG